MKGVELAQFLAQMEHESWDFEKMVEVPSNKNYFKKYTDTYKTDIYDSSLHGNFQSTSILPNVASGNFMGQPCCLCQILLMPETSCLFLAISGLSHEREILL
ncbi:MAG: hypothetical protein EBT86_12850, partial [Actinobacteria bacterium]|nr:hypothetical protein [Actinomycetota bacterium]